MSAVSLARRRGNWDNCDDLLNAPCVDLDSSLAGGRGVDPDETYELLRDVLRRALTDDGWHMCSVPLVELIALGHAAGAHDVDTAAAITAARDYLTCASSRTETGRPDFVAEVISPGDTFAEVEAKALDWLAAGTKLVLVIDPARRTATTYRGPEDVQVHTGDALLDLGDAVPGWRVALPDFFR